MSSSTLRLLISGEYLCPIRYRDEYESLLEQDYADEVNVWLGKLNLRLARVTEEGAFFAAPAVVSTKDIAVFKNQMLKFRDEYGPALFLLNFVRQTDMSGLQLVPGEYVALYDLERAVSQSSMLESQLKGLLGVIGGAAHRNSNHENLKRLLDQLAKDGFAVLANRDSGTYQITGKVEQLYAVLQHLAEHNVIPDEDVDDRPADDSADLLDGDVVEEEGRDG